MELRQYRHVLALADHASFRKASDDAVKPGISRSVRSATLPKMAELGHVQVRCWWADSSAQLPAVERITHRWHLVAASLGLGLLAEGRS